MTNSLFATDIVFMLLTIVMYALLLMIVNNGLKRMELAPQRRPRQTIIIGVGIIVWALLTGGLAGLGVFTNFTSFPPTLFFFISPPLIFSIILVNLPAVKRWLMVLPPAVLVLLQLFRIVVEILLWWLFIQNKIPIQMTFEGLNFDVVAGVTAPIMAYLYARKKISDNILLLWNIGCLALLLNIVTIAILSTPVPFRLFMNEPANTIIAYFPYIWLPTMLVPLAYTLHFMSVKQLLLRMRKSEEV